MLLRTVDRPDNPVARLTSASRLIHVITRLCKAMIAVSTLDMSLLALVPARGGSKRIPRKNITDFHGKPMIAYPLEAAFAAGIFDCIHVSTDDPEIRQIAVDRGADVSLERPAALADDMTGLLPVARWTLQAFAARGRRFDAVFILYPCSPMLTARDLNGAFEMFKRHGGKKNLLTVGKNPVPAEWLYHQADDGRLVPLTPGGAFQRSQDLEAAYFETGTFTVFSAAYLLMAGQLTDDANYIGYELPQWKAIDIDTPEDLERARDNYQFYRAQLSREMQT